MRAALVIACLAGAAFAAEAEIYRWRDTQGRVHYGNVPPRDAAEVARLDRAPHTPPRPPAVGRRLAPMLTASGPTGFPGRVDEATVASMGRALVRHDEALPERERRRPSPPQLSALQLP